MIQEIKTEKCTCGDRACKDYWLVGVGKFNQGSGFNEAVAKRIAALLNRDGVFMHMQAMGEDQ